MATRLWLHPPPIGEFLLHTEGSSTVFMFFTVAPSVARLGSARLLCGQFRPLGCCRPPLQSRRRSRSPSAPGPTRARMTFVRSSVPPAPHGAPSRVKAAASVPPAAVAAWPTPRPISSTGCCPRSRSGARAAIRFGSRRDPPGSNALPRDSRANPGGRTPGRNESCCGRMAQGVRESSLRGRLQHRLRHRLDPQVCFEFEGLKQRCRMAIRLSTGFRGARCRGTIRRVRSERQGARAVSVEKYRDGLGRSGLVP